jgi:predicted ATPase
LNQVPTHCCTSAPSGHPPYRCNSTSRLEISRIGRRSRPLLEAFRSDASNLVAFLFLLKTKHPDSYRRIVSTVRLAAPFFDDFVIIPVGG